MYTLSLLPWKWWNSFSEEKPDSVLPTLGGQAGLNLAMELEERGFLKEHNVKLIGTTAETIRRAEDRQEFKDTMEKIHEPVAASKVVHSWKREKPLPGDRLSGGSASRLYPGRQRRRHRRQPRGAGGDPLQRTALKPGGRSAGRALYFRMEEIEYEVMRDGAGNVITVCNMENIDPVGVHTGDSIVVAPSQTLGDKEYQMLRTSALNIISELKITGGCNVQFALHPESFEYCVIEGKSQGEPFFRPGVQGYRLSHRQGGGQDRPGLYPG